METLQERMTTRAAEVEAALRNILASRASDGEIERPGRLMAAMRHGVLNGGKRLRPFLVMETTALFDGPAEAACVAGAALECVHCYSLIHDDLPAMDDDDLRRGQPTVHVAFDEATAILAGDSLLTLAFAILAGPLNDLPDARKTLLVSELARAAGCGGMAGGQMLDLLAPRAAYGEQDIVRLQAMKTGALIRFACRAGAIVSGAGADDLDRVTAYGEAVGLAFQIADDLLDLTAASAQLGKATGKDAAAGKATLVALHGEKWARAQLQGLVGQAQEALAPFGPRAETLNAVAQFVASRDN
jgi:farnesyl diphosphate synthase